jgi:hypothetical protein
MDVHDVTQECRLGQVVKLHFRILTGKAQARIPTKDTEEEWPERGGENQKGCSLRREFVNCI